VGDQCSDAYPLFGVSMLEWERRVARWLRQHASTHERVLHVMLPDDAAVLQVQIDGTVAVPQGPHAAEYLAELTSLRAVAFHLTPPQDRRAESVTRNSTSSSPTARLSRARRTSRRASSNSGSQPRSSEPSPEGMLSLSVVATEPPPLDQLIVTHESVAKKVLEGFEASCSFLRLPIVDCAAVSWLKRYSEFLDGVGGGLRSQQRIIVAATDVSSLFYPLSALIVSNHDESRTVRPTTIPQQLRFVEEFLWLIGATEDLCIDVNVTLSGHCNGAYATEIATALSPNEEGWTHVTGRKVLTLHAVRLSERYCWLLLLRLYVRSTPSIAVRPSFCDWVMSKHSKALDWLRYLDPWTGDETLSPDVNHVTYTHMYARWFSPDRIVQAV